MFLLSNLVAAPGVPIQTLGSARNIPDENLGNFDKREIGLGIFATGCEEVRSWGLQVLRREVHHTPD
jgi:hypothetical protein